MADDLFPKFLYALRPHAFCVSCLGRMYEEPEHAVRAALQPLTERLTSQVGECRGCTQTTETYRLP
jgi:hypothetical protein